MRNSTSSSSTFGLSVDLLAFLGVLAMAVYSQWNAKDLLWGLWISSLSIGYLTLMAGFFGNVLQGRLMDDQSGNKVDDEKKQLLPKPCWRSFSCFPLGEYLDFPW
jgi:hypothetical protein